MKEKLLLGVAAICLLFGCSTQSVVAVPHDVAPCEVCVTPDASDRKIAYNATLKALRQKGFTVREVSAAGTGDCSTVLTCQTVSRWDMANFTASISYEWFENGKLLGRAKYQAKNGLNFSKFIDTEEKVNELLNRMLPGTPALATRYGELRRASLTFRNC